MNQRICHPLEDAFFNTTSTTEINVTDYSAHLEFLLLVDCELLRRREALVEAIQQLFSFELCS